MADSPVQEVRIETQPEYELPPFSLAAIAAGALLEVFNASAGGSAAHGDLRVTSAVVMNDSTDFVTAIDDHGRQFIVKKQQSNTWDLSNLSEGGAMFLAIRPNSNVNAGDVQVVLRVRPAIAG